MPLQATSGAASQDAYGGNGVAVVPTFIEDTFSCFLYTGNGTSQTITNGVDLAGKGGMVWIKSRSNATSNTVFDTVRGATKFVTTDTTNNQDTISDTLTAFNSTGFTLGSDALDGKVNTSPRTYASWTFRKQPKFFDVVTYSGNSGTQNIAHNLGSVPGCIIVKFVSGSAGVGNWPTWHRGLSSGNIINLNLTGGQGGPFPTYFGNNTITVDPTSTQFTVGSNANVNESGSNYVAYLFAHDAGGFGLTGTDNVISCGSFNYNTFPQTVELGYEPQWLMVKQTDGVGDWIMFDNMRGFTANSGGGAGKRLLANTSGAETANDGLYYGSATGFNLNLPAAGNYIYIAIRRGPMKVPTTGTSVYKSSLLAGNSSTQQITDLNFPPDLVMTKARDTSYGNRWTDRLRGFGRALRSDDVGAELDNTTSGVNPFNMNGYTVLSGNPYNQSGFNYVNHAMRRAPSFFDEVCYTGNNVSGRTITHNLAAVPELMIVKSRTSATRDWIVYDATNGATKYMNLNNNSASGAGSVWASTAPTSTVFTVSDSSSVNDPAQNYVAYLFATCAGVSKVGSYTGNGSTQTINCGFTGGARFVLIKATSTTGDWMVSDSARGIIAGSDPYLELNNTNAEVTGEDWLDTDSTGFVVNEVSGSNANTNGATYIFLAIA